MWKVSITLLLALTLPTLQRPVVVQDGLHVRVEDVRSGSGITAENALADPRGAFELWVAQNGKDYRGQEKSRREEIFLENARMIVNHNAANTGFKMSLNEFADMTFEEFSGYYLGYNAELKATNGESEAKIPGFMYENATDLPAEWDWRKQGAVTAVKNQYMCGSCWAFSTTGAIEGINHIRTGKLVPLSEQQLVSCDHKQDLGCSGGLMDYAFEYVTKNGGLDTESDYGYWSFDLPCQSAKESDRHVVSIDGFQDVPPGSHAALKAAVAHQPVSVAICANSALQFYSSGVFSADACCQQLNHGVLAVGYQDGDAAGTGSGNWLVKNSWGTGWGESGYFRLERTDAKNPNGPCSIYQAPSYPVKKGSDNPEHSSFCGYFGFTECAPHNRCTCQWNLLDLFCLSWGCEAGEPAEL